MPFVNNNQREGFASNSAAGADFERIAYEYFLNKENIMLQKNYELEIGIELKKRHRFDLGNDNILIECKSQYGQDVVFYEYFTDGKYCEIYDFEKWKNVINV